MKAQLPFVIRQSPGVHADPRSVLVGVSALARHPSTATDAPGAAIRASVSVTMALISFMSLLCGRTRTGFAATGLATIVSIGLAMGLSCGTGDGPAVQGSGGDGAGGTALGSGGSGGSGVGGGGVTTGGSGGHTATGTGGVAGALGAGGSSSIGAGGSGVGGGTGGATRDAGAAPDAGPIVIVTPPVSDPTSTLGISAPGSGYHVEGNLPYGPLTMQRLDVIYPNAAGPKGNITLPAVIMFHGGGWIDNKPAALKASMSSFFSRFLKHGFLVCNVEYRLADGTPNGAIAPAAVQDALLAAKWFWDRLDYYHVDRTRYVVTGASAGGHLALMVGMATPDAMLGPTSPTDYKIAAIVNGYGPPDVTDLLARGVSFAEQWLPASEPNRAALAIRVSPITYARQDIPPLITVQGANDTTVPIPENQHLDQVLKADGADAAIHLVAGAGHGFTTPAAAWPDAEATMFAFLVAHGIGQ
jgi:acetyl esterase/lipase